MDRRVTKTKKAIKEAYLKLLVKNEYGAISVKDLTELADISRSTFYLHYYDVNAVLEELIDEMFDKISFFIPEGDLKADEIKETIARMAKVIKEDHVYSLLCAKANAYPYFSDSMLRMMKEKIRPDSSFNAKLNSEEKVFLMLMISKITVSITNYLIRRSEKS